MKVFCVSRLDKTSAEQMKNTACQADERHVESMVDA